MVVGIGCNLALLSRDHPLHRRILPTLKDPVLTTQGLQREDFTLEEEIGTSKVDLIIFRLFLDYE